MRKTGMALFGAVITLGACATTEGLEEPTPLQPDATYSDTHDIPVPPPIGAEEDFGVLANLAGTRWRGAPNETESEEAFFVDISEWYWDLGGTVLVNRHVLEDGVYGGVTYIQKNAETGELDYVYVTSGGFRTLGQYTLDEDGTWSAYERIEGMDDITGVRSYGSIDPEDGTMFVHSTYETPTGLMPGQAMVYTPYDGPMPVLAPLNE